MAGLTDFIADQDLSSNPATGKVTGDTNPASTQNGVITKLRDIDTDEATDLVAEAGIFDPHNHDPGLGSGPGGRPIGTGGVAAIGAGQVVQSIIRAGAITGGKTADNAIGTAELADDTIAKDQVGIPQSLTKSVTGSGNVTFNFQGTSVLPLFSVEASHAGPNPAFTYLCPTNSSVKVIHSASMDITVRAIGCTGMN